MQDVTWLVFAKTFWTRITSVFFLGRHYHRICHQLNIYGMNLVDVFATIKIYRKHYRSSVTHLWNNIPQAFIQRLIGSMRRRCEAVVAARGGHTRYWTPQTPILHDNLCLSMICSDNDIGKFCWYCCCTHMNLNYTIFVDLFSLCKKILSIKPLYRFFCWLVYMIISKENNEQTKIFSSSEVDVSLLTIWTMVLLPHCFAMRFRPFGFLTPKDFQIIWI